MSKMHIYKNIINVNFGILGVEFCWALLIPNCSAILLYLGASASMLAYLWLLPPFVGLVINPLVGHLSDLTTTRFGRRRPYIFGGIFAVCIFCTAIPYATSLWLGTILLALLMAVLNFAQNPLRALTADIIPKHHLTVGFSVQMIFFGLGAVFGAAMPWLFGDISFKFTGTHQPSFLTLAFFVGGVLTLLTGLWTCFFVKEKPCENNQDEKPGLKELFRVLFKMPPILRQISLVQFLMWVGFFIMFAYYNVSIAQTLFGLPPGAKVMGNPIYSEIVKKATVFNSLCFIFFQASSFGVAFLIPVITTWIPRKIVATIALILGGLGLLSIPLKPEINYFTAAITLGIAWGCSTSVHLAMIASNLAKERMGLYNGLFLIANCLSQIVTGLIAGPVIKYVFHNHVFQIVAYSGLFFLVAAFCNQFIRDLGEVREECEKP
ncbi:MFS transporter [Simkania sp.]|uniref:MFS transporter n=1 Tax=Simkania sp. TaxID=34094 RepID=UPI003B516AC4